MRKIFATSLLAFLSVAVCCFCLFYVVTISDEAKESVEKIQSYILKSDYRQAQEKTEELDKFWVDQHTVLSTIVHHIIIEEIEESITLLKASFQNTGEDRFVNSWNESARSLSRIKNLRDLEIPSIANIF